MGTTREIRPVDMEQVINYIRENLKIEINTSINYVGSLGRTMYEDSRTLKLVLGDEVIGEVYL